MANENNSVDKAEQNSRDRIALFVSLIFVFAIGFLGYRFLNNSNNVKTAFYNVNREASEITDTEANIIASSTKRDIELEVGEFEITPNTDDSVVLGTNVETNVETDNEVIEAELVTETQITKDVTEETTATTSTVVTTNDSSNTAQDTWTAKDYHSGEIQAGGNHTVQEGDTLWEIAEAAYGNGAEWTQILNANMEAIGQLPNGQQALIMPGQSLVIPQIN
jgi:nucleoid-associated protein YgaU